MSKFKIDFKKVHDVNIELDDKPLNGISGVDIKLRPGKFPEVTLIPAVTELQFGDQASVDMYVDMLELKTVEMLLSSLNRKISYEAIGD